MTIRMLSVIASLICIQAFAASPQLQQLGKTTMGRNIIQQMGVSATVADLEKALLVKYGPQGASVIMAKINQYNQAVSAPGANADEAARTIFQVNAQGRVNFAALSGSNRDNMINLPTAPAAAPSTAPSCGNESLAQLAARVGGYDIVTAEKMQLANALKGGQNGCAIHTFKEPAQKVWSYTSKCKFETPGTDDGPSCIQAAWQGSMVPVIAAQVTAAAKSAYQETATSCELFAN